MNHICANIMGHLNQKGFYSVLQVSLQLIQLCLLFIQNKPQSCAVVLVLRKLLRSLWWEKLVVEHCWFVCGHVFLQSSRAESPHLRQNTLSPFCHYCWISVLLNHLLMRWTERTLQYFSKLCCCRFVCIWFVYCSVLGRNRFNFS